MLQTISHFMIGSTQRNTLLNCGFKVLALLNERACKKIKLPFRNEVVIFHIF